MCCRGANSGGGGRFCDGDKSLDKGVGLGSVGGEIVQLAFFHVKGDDAHVCGVGDEPHRNNAVEKIGAGGNEGGG